MQELPPWFGQAAEEHSRILGEPNAGQGADLEAESEARAQGGLFRLRHSG